jgi:cytochrome c-type biogenesis protein CcmE
MKGNAKYLIGAAVVLIGVVLLLTSSLQNNLVFFITPTEFTRDEAKYDNRTLRLGGVVEPGTLKFDRESQKLTFTISDGTTKLPIVHTGTGPDLMREGVGVTVQGKLQNGDFKSEELLVRHSEEYRAPKPGETIDYRRIMDSIEENVKKESP